MLLTTRNLFSLVLLLGLFVMTAREVSDPDTWWHLRAGQWMIENRAIPHTDIFSFTNPDKEWITHEWLSEVFIYGVYRVAGWGGLIIAFSLVLTAAFGITYLRCAGRPYLAALVLLLAALATAPTWGVRPQILSLLLSSVFLLITGSYARGGPRRPLIWLVPLTLLWVNLHSGYAFGLGLIGLTLAGVALDGLFGFHSRAVAWVRFRTLALILLSCVAVVPLNPNGLRMYSYPFETLTSHAMQTYIQEWFSPDFHLLEFQPFALLLIGSIAAVALARTRARPSDILFLGVLGYAGLRSARHIPLFALAAAPILAQALWDTVSEQRWARFLQIPAHRPIGMQTVLNATILLLLVVACALRMAQVAGNQAAVEASKWPEAAVEAIQKQQVQGPIYNAYGWGGYLIWKLYPTYKVYIDGRADVYGDVFIEEYLKTYRGSEGWQEPLDRYGVRAVLVEPYAPVAAILRHTVGWRVAYEDVQAVILVRVQ